MMTRRRSAKERKRRREKRERRVAEKVARVLCPPDPAVTEHAWRQQRQLMQMAGRSMRGPLTPDVIIIDSVSEAYQRCVESYRGKERK